MLSLIRVLITIERVVSLILDELAKQKNEQLRDAITETTKARTKEEKLEALRKLKDAYHGR